MLNSLTRLAPAGALKVRPLPILLFLGSLNSTIASDLSVNALLGREDGDLVGQRLHPYRPVGGLDLAGVAQMRDGVLHPFGVVAVGEVVMRVRPAAFLPRFRPGHR